MDQAVIADDDGAALIDVRAAAQMVGRSPETVRRWVWSGRLSARREGNRLLVSPADVLALRSENGGGSTMTLGEWADAAHLALAEAARSSGGSAADLVLADRAHRAINDPES